MKQIKFYAVLVTTAICFNLSSPTIINAKELSNIAVKEEILNTDIVTARKEDLYVLLKTLESKHPDIYNRNDKSVFDKKLIEIDAKLGIMSNFDFAIAVSELTALVGDSHTKAAIGSVLGERAHFLPINLTIVEEGLLITAIPDEHKQVLGGILTSINGIPMDEIKQKLLPMFSFDNQIYLDKEFASTFYVYEILEHYGVLNSPENISLEIELGDKVETIQVNAVNSKTMNSMKVARIERSIPETIRDKSKIYFFKSLDSETLYIQYNSCREDKDLPMETFAKQVHDVLTQNQYSRVILDLRYNGGGSDGVIRPLMNILEEKYKQDGVQLYTLIGSNTFSSALINSVMLKEIGSVIVGSPTGGSVNHFGSVSVFELPNSKINIQHSNKFFDLSTLLDEAKPYEVEPFLPDIFAEQTREDYLLGKDTAVQAVLSDTENKVTPKMELTRSALAVELGRDYIERTDNTMNSLQSNFEDVSIFSYFTPYIVWAKTNNIMIGENETTFSPDRPVTRAELAVVLMRYAELMGTSLNDIPKTWVEILDINSVQHWEEDAVKVFGGTNMFPLREGMFQPEEIVTREVFDSIFKEFKMFIN